jgi:DNA-binding response OmpR family regulator
MGAAFQLTRVWDRFAGLFGKAGADAKALHGTPAGARPLVREKNFLDSTIMLVDDEPICLEITQALLEDAGYTRFIATSDSREAMRLITEKKPDVLLLDIMMPGLSGFDLLEAMERENVLRDVPTIVLTSARDQQTKLHALDLNVTEFLTKPVDPSELVLRVRNTLAAKAYWQGCWDRGGVESGAAA